jgi:hypothetical protein
MSFFGTVAIQDDPVWGHTPKIFDQLMKGCDNFHNVNFTPHKRFTPVKLKYL